VLHIYIYVCDISRLRVKFAERSIHWKYRSHTKW